LAEIGVRLNDDLVPARQTGWSSLERQLPLWASVLVLGALAVYGLVALQEVRSALMAAGRSRLSSVTEQVTGLLQQSAQQRFQETRSLSSRPELAAFLTAGAGADPAAAAAVVRPIIGANPQQRAEVMLGDASGAERLWLASWPARQPPLLPKTLQAGLTPLQLFGGSVFYDSVAEVAGPDHRPLGHIVVRRFLSSPQAASAINQLIGSGAALLLGNRAGGLWTDMARVVPAPAADLRAAVKKPVESRNRTAAPVIGQAAAVPATPWIVWVELDQATLLAPMRRLEGRFAIVGLLVLLLAAGASWVLSRSVTRPIRQMTLTAAAMARGDFSRRVPEPAQIELGRLARSFNHMTEELAAARAELEQRVASRTRELAQAVTQLQTAQEELVREEKMATLGRLASSVGHELRNPLAVMTNAVYYLDAVLREVPPQVREYLGILRHEIGLSEKIVGDLLDFARIKPPQLQAIRLTDLVESQIERLGTLDGVSIVRQFDSDIPPVWADPAQIGQIIFNLLTNAIQAVAERNGTITVRARHSGGRAVVEVEDDGPGVPPDLRERIFEPLFTTKARGIGLGLSVSKSLAEANSGTLRLARSAAESSSVFVLELSTAAKEPP
jgi:signal transduction histidine kinase